MGFVESELMEGEQIVSCTKLHPIIFLWTAIFLILGCFLSSWMIVVFWLIWGVFKIITFITSEFAITNKRVLVKKGFIRRKSLEILLVKIEGIQVNQSILGRLLNYGNIIVKGTGGTKTPFKKIMNPIVFRKTVQEQIEKN